jgi:uncharacterized protein (TIGR00255 family)
LLQSMTGFGEAHQTDGGLNVAIEIRSVNSRYFKLSIRAGDRYSVLEPRIDSIVRERIQRGTVQVSVRATRARVADDFAINVTALASYRDQLERLHDQWHISENVEIESLLSLPGVVDEQPSRPVDADADWPLIESTLRQAIAELETMRSDEGQAMENDLRANCQAIGEDMAAVAEQAPKVAGSYRDRIKDRVNKLLAEYEVTLESSDILREVSLFADRCDISEEIVRMASHLDQFDSIITLSDDSEGTNKGGGGKGDAGKGGGGKGDTRKSAGRKLEFLTQEMFRETNTIGSKANDVVIARHVIEIKTTIEKIREMIQNIE